jgi:aldehyde dehydrogenase (NAD+)
VSAARAAFQSFSVTSREERLELLDRIGQVYKKRFTEMGETISREMGAPLSFATRFQAGAGLGHFKTAYQVLKTYAFSEQWGTTQVEHEPIGVCGMITPWNWPANQIACKIAPALAAGCTMVLKPSEVGPFSAMLIAEILDEAGVPAGVFNLVNGDGPGVGRAIASHPGIDMISFTGSTGAGIDVAIKAAPTVKRVGQELGGKSANILLDDADFEKSCLKVSVCVFAMPVNPAMRRPECWCRPIGWRKLHNLPVRRRTRSLLGIRPLRVRNLVLLFRRFNGTRYRT